MSGLESSLTRVQCPHLGSGLYGAVTSAAGRVDPRYQALYTASSLLHRRPLLLLLLLLLLAVLISDFGSYV